ncbi:CYTH domain-containing protein [Lactobacillus psittaci]|uniref:Adenylate cyclase family protein n=1 Tax=Lactobacillus psittaci DSM 15354 TaxID=1122152 RepID=A0A0R1S8L2_9LACO|nr:CYTH domain-containing protein [Lactobacillus psittaci]KRL63860.1 adenylate cyclase family protein [Lactobacillus psittaci DSM 15354]
MSKNLELESKTLITPTIYQNIVTTFAKENEFWQSNYYFDDTNSTLKAAKISLRIRLYDDHAEQTMKIPTPKKSNFHSSVELTDALTLSEAESFLKKVQTGDNANFNGSIGQYLKQHFPDINLRLFTYSKTKRCLLNGPQNCELTLDETHYPDGYFDFELEIENDDAALIQAVLQKLKHDFNFEKIPEKKHESKIARASKHKI